MCAGVWYNEMRTCFAWRNTGSANTPSSPLSPDFYYILSSFLPLYTAFFSKKNENKHVQSR